MSQIAQCEISRRANWSREKGTTQMGVISHDGVAFCRLMPDPVRKVSKVSKVGTRLSNQVPTMAKDFFFLLGWKSVL